MPRKKRADPASRKIVTSLVTRQKNFCSGDAFSTDIVTPWVLGEDDKNSGKRFGNDRPSHNPIVTHPAVGLSREPGRCL
jgi:hypothetical protein